MALWACAGQPTEWAKRVSGCTQEAPAAAHTKGASRLAVSQGTGALVCGLGSLICRTAMEENLAQGAVCF